MQTRTEQLQQSLWEPATREQRIWGVPRCSLRAKAITWAIDCVGRRKLAEEGSTVAIDDGGDLCLECTLDELVVESGLSRRTVQHGLDDAVRRGILDVDQQTGRPYWFWVRWRRIAELAPPLAPVQVSGCTGAESAVAPVQPAPPAGVQTGGCKGGGKGGVSTHSTSLDAHELIENKRSKTQSTQCIEGASLRGGAARVQPAGDEPRREPPWCWTKAQLADPCYVDEVIVPAAIAKWRLPDAEITVRGLQASAVCAVVKCRDAPRCFTDFCQRQAWLLRGRGGIAEKYFEQAAAARRGTLRRLDEGKQQAQAARDAQRRKDEARAAFVREFGE